MCSNRTLQFVVFAGKSACIISITIGDSFKSLPFSDCISPISIKYIILSNDFNSSHSVNILSSKFWFTQGIRDSEDKIYFCSLFSLNSENNICIC